MACFLAASLYLLWTLVAAMWPEDLIERCPDIVPGVRREAGEDYGRDRDLLD